MKDFIAVQDRPLLEAAGLSGFDALWDARMPAVDEPNRGRGGWSAVYKLKLGGAAYYIKRQSDYLIHSAAHPLGEPTLTREFRNIRRYHRRGIPTLDVAFFGQRKVAGERRAILLTRALDGWNDLASWLEGWSEVSVARRETILRACGELVRQLHQAGQRHGCLYPKHIFLREQGERFDTCLIDLEKTRPLMFGRGGRERDLDALVRRAGWRDGDVATLLAAYLGCMPDAARVDRWRRRLLVRSISKDAQP